MKKKFKEVKPIFIKENKLKVIAEFIEMNTFGIVKEACKQHFRDVMAIDNPDPDKLFELFNDYLKTCFRHNEALRKNFIDIYKEA